MTPPELTLYDLLQVSRVASPEVIRGAYRSLSQVYHPDLNPGNPSAARMMAAINAAYAVLADPSARARYDRRLRESATPVAASARRPQPKEARTSALVSAEPRGPVAKFAKEVVGAIAQVLLPAITPFAFVGLLFAFGWIYLSWKDESRTADSPITIVPYDGPTVARTSSLRPTAPSWVRPDTTPFGVNWPSQASYLEGARRQRTSGRSSVTVDNTRNDASVHVKLRYTGAMDSSTVREFFIPAFSSFRVESVAPGEYDVRYRDLTSGALARSEGFTLKQRRTSNSVEFSNLTLTLYKVANGNMQTYGLRESEF